MKFFLNLGELLISFLYLKLDKVKFLPCLVLVFQTSFKIYSNKVVSNSAPGGDKDARSILAQQEGLDQSFGQESLLQNIYAQGETTTPKST